MTAGPLEWYYGPTWWNPNPGIMWHYDCSDRIRAGHNGEVFFWSDGSASCAGCGRRQEPDGSPVPVSAITLL